MDVVSIGKKEYRKATLVARDFGYTKDYLGQLCRSEKVDARLVGRTWYVDPTSIEEHKKNKQRSNLEKSKKALRESAGNRVKVAVRQPANKNFFDHLPKATKITSYENDEADLVPLVEKKTQNIHKLEVELADAEKLVVQSKTQEYVISASKHPRIRFKGDVNVESHEDEIAPDEDSVKLEEEVLPVAEEKKPILKIFNTSKQEKSELVSEEVSDAAVELADDEVMHLQIHSVDSGPQVRSGRLLFMILSATTVIVLLVSALAVGLETTVVATADSLNEQYSFSVKNLLAQIYIEK